MLVRLPSSPHNNRLLLLRLRLRLHLVLLLLLLLLPCFASPCHACNQLDREPLLSFFLNISSPLTAPLNWSSADCCLWEGIACNQNDGRVTHIWLPFRGLGGGISPSLENLTHLSHLNLSHNWLFGTLPAGLFSSLNRLEIIDLSYNHLTGELPPSLSSTIQTVDLSSNHFHGAIQSSLLQLAWNLTGFNASNNSFSGPIPSSICINSSHLIRLLDFSFNNFSGQIPRGLGKCSELEVLRAGFNSLSGMLPSDIYNATALQQISLPVNKLSGPISTDIVHLSNLRILELYSNELSGSLPQNIGNLSNLEQLLLHMNNLSGSLPTSLMNCTNLTKLNLRVNFLERDLSTLDFSKLLKLSTVDLGNNNFTGSLPVSLYLCKSLTAVRLASNKLAGQILPDILSLQFLSFLSLSNNKLSNITAAIRILMGCKNLSTVILSRNFLDETMPDDDSIVDSDGFQNLQVLGLGGCQLTGQVPAWLAKLKNLEVLDLSENRIMGSVPAWLGTMPNLFYIDLSANFMTGELPKELSGLPKLASEQAANEVDQSYLELPVFVEPNNATNQQYNQLSSLPPAIYLGNNSLSGNIPFEIGQLKFLHVLDLSHNNFYGNIPDQLSNLSNLERLDLSGNHLSGEIPVSLRSLHFLSWFSVADNDLQGPIPSGGQFDTFPSSSFEENPGLCGPILQQSCTNQPATIYPSAPSKRPNKRLFIGLILGICFGIGFILTMLALWILSKRRILPREDNDKINLDTISCNSTSGVPPEVSEDSSLVILFPSKTNEIKDLTISEILKATDNFNQANIIGCGGFGLVYKATLANGIKLAVKKLSGDLGLMEREFKAEVEALSTAQHKNLVSLQGYCIHEGFRLLIYSYMENGSLDYWLHEKT
ncbi:hypothetical protein L1049_005069 [Liquidambar formosana]|uniref:non-specific serine/threonine protein kinase n=1 Tax=Liquidambar formosana TaxID=63359 RepID=A0AAP0WXE8_LIQFO